MFPLPSPTGYQSYLRRAPSAVELNGRIDTIHEESIHSARSSQGLELDKDQILLDVDEFVTKYHLDDIRDLIKNGALLHHDPEDPTVIGSLTQEEHMILSQSTKEVSAIPMKMVTNTSSYVIGVGAILYGCLLHFDVEFFEETYSHSSIWLNSAPWIGSALFGCMFTVPLNRLLGRRKAICVAAFLALVASCGKMLLRLQFNFEMSLLVNLLAGTSMGILGCTVPLYVAETGVASSRGLTIAIWNISVMFSEGLVYFGKLWSLKGFPYRINLDIDFGILMIVPSAIILMVVIFANRVPESPYWCVSNGRMQEAFQSLCFFRKAKFIAARDLWQVYLADMHGIHRGGDGAQYPSFTSQLTMSFANPQLRRAIVATAAIILTRNLSAIQVAQANLYGYVMDKADQRYHDPSIAAFFVLFTKYLASNVTIMSMIIFAVWLDKIGRRTFLMGLTLVMFLLLQIPGIDLIAANTKISSVVALCFYIIFYQTTDMFHTVYTAEVFPTQHNDIGMAIAMSVNHGSLVMVSFGHFYLRRTKLFPSQHSLSIPLFVSFLLVWLVMRETKKVSLEDIGRIFDTPTRNLILYHINVQLPYLFKRYIMFKDVTLTALEDSRYRFAAITLDDTEALSAGASREGRSD